MSGANPTTDEASASASGAPRRPTTGPSPYGAGTTPSQSIRVKRQGPRADAEFRPSPSPSLPVDTPRGFSEPVALHASRTDDNALESLNTNPDSVEPRARASTSPSGVGPIGRFGTGTATGRRRGYSITERLWGEDGYQQLSRPRLGKAGGSASALSQQQLPSSAQGSGLPTLSTAGDANLNLSLPASNVSAIGRARSPSVASTTSSNNPVNVIIPGESLGRARRSSIVSQAISEEDHHAQEVDLLDVLDPAVSTTATLTNIQGAFWPNIFARKPIVEIEPLPPIVETRSNDPTRKPDGESSSTIEEHPLTKTTTINTIPDGEDDEEEEEEDELDLLDEHLKKLLKKQKRKETFRLQMQGIKAFLKTPLGVFFFIYGSELLHPSENSIKQLTGVDTLACCPVNVVVWGAGLVLLLMIPMGSYAKKLWVEVCSQVLTGLFCITSLFPLPWRLMDAYNICIIWHYAVVTRKRRAKGGLPPLRDPNDLPDPAEAEYWIGAGGEKMTGPRVAPAVVPPRKSKLPWKKNKDVSPDANGTASNAEPIPLEVIESHVSSDALDEVVVLSDKEEAKLRHAQAKFARSQNYYRPHTTPTHHAFPIKQAIWISFFMIGNSAFQAILCGVMWGLNRFDRPAWTTGCLIPLSFGCGIAGAVLIWQCSERTKRKAEVTAKVWRMMKKDEEELQKRRKEATERRVARHKEKKHRLGAAGLGALALGRKSKVDLEASKAADL
ncbi:BQ5605_C014g07559 [Microbotryum silenes-dioicae]|uniref:BQ5605_C014g07559 protein n=1 Tax=Microbotryum silenes-dioicae TaxID=796604 RepID=A0A2X0MNN0_9BASI|nr:BQ5605_C014g07559 [Microbotryum silenes-dioicae]